jgi:hypothetical protein
MELLFKLLSGSVPPKEQELEAVKFIYDTLADIFRSSTSLAIRVIAVDEGLIKKILDRIGLVSKEHPR